MEDEFTAGGRGVDVFLQAPEPDIVIAQVGDEGNEVLEGAPKAVQPPDDQRIPCPQVVQRAARRIREELYATSPRERVRLEVERLVLGGDAGVSYQHAGPVG